MSNPSPILPPVEFSRRIPVDSISREEKVFEIDADAKERLDLARRFNLVSLDSLKAGIRLVLKKNDIHLSGELEADVVQSCAVSMKPVRSHIKATFERTFTTTEEDEEVDETEIKIDADTIEPPDRLVDGAVEIGECTAEQLALEIPPFPRIQGIVFEGFSSDPGDRDNEQDNSGPFSKLAKIREKLK